LAKDIRIEIDGVAHIYHNVKKLKTKSKSGGTVTWVPEDEFPLGNKKVAKNGIYKAQNDDLYGYRKFTIGDVEKPHLTGIDKDGRHKSYDIDELGEIRTLILPDSIQLITASDFKIAYRENEQINLTGLTVVAKSKGDKWQDVEDSALIPSRYKGSIVPLDEIEIEPAYAHKLDPKLPWGKVKVIWERLIDYKELTAEFQITIVG